MFYILDGKIPIEVTRENWARKNYRVDLTKVDGYIISTVFLGIDHNYYEGGEPILFETMIFDSNDNAIYQERYSTWDEAEEGHFKACEWLKNKLMHYSND